MSSAFQDTLETSKDDGGIKQFNPLLEDNSLIYSKLIEMFPNDKPDTIMLDTKISMSLDNGSGNIPNSKESASA